MSTALVRSFRPQPLIRKLQPAFVTRAPTSRQQQKGLRLLAVAEEFSMGGKRERGSRDDWQEETVEIEVARRVFVGNLSYNTSWQDLKDHFSQVGTVRFADVIRERGSGGRSKGCGIVEFDSPDDAARAILELHDSELGGRAIFVREDREDSDLRREPQHSDDEPGEERGPAKRQFRGRGAGGTRVFVTNLSYETGWQELKDHFKQAGRVVHANILTDMEGRPRGFGVVEFERPEEAERAIERLADSELMGRQINVREDREGPNASQADRRVTAPRGDDERYNRRSNDDERYNRRSNDDERYNRRSNDDERYNRRSKPTAAPGTQIVVQGLPYRTAWQDLKDMCKPAGDVLRADIAKNPDGSSKGWGTVAFETPEDAQAAVQLLDGSDLEGRTITAKLDRFV